MRDFSNVADVGRVRLTHLAGPKAIRKERHLCVTSLRDIFATSLRRNHARTRHNLFPLCPPLSADSEDGIGSTVSWRPRTNPTRAKTTPRKHRGNGLRKITPGDLRRTLSVSGHLSWRAYIMSRIPISERAVCTAGAVHTGPRLKYGNIQRRTVAAQRRI